MITTAAQTVLRKHGVGRPSDVPEQYWELVEQYRSELVAQATSILGRVEDAEEGYQSMVGLYEKKLYPSVDGIRNVIRLLGATNEKIRRLKAEDLVDDSVVKKLEKDGRL